MIDGVLALNEIIDFASRKKRVCLLVKVNFAIAYDCVSWEYLKHFIGRINFGRRWLKWMNMLVFSSSMLVLINGNPSVDFEVGRGLQQRDPLSLFLFILVVEGPLWFN